MEETKKGRPKKEAGTTKPVVQSIRYTQAEWDDLKLKLQESGLTYTQFMHQAAQRAKVIKYNMADYAAIRDARLELKRIGININNITRHGAMVTDSETLDIFMQDLRNCRDIAKELYANLQKIEKAIKPR